MMSGSRFNWRSIVLVMAVSVLALGTIVWADYVGSLTNRIFLDPATIPAIIDGYQNGDEIAYILETTPRNTGSINGVAAWMTLYVPAGVEVIGASFVTQAGDGSWVDIPAEDGDDAYLDCGSRNCNRFDDLVGAFQIDDGGIHEVNHDNGIFYSTDPRTANTITEILPAVSPTGPQTKPAIVFNQWDYDQVLAFGMNKLGGVITAAYSGNSGKGNTPIFSTDSGSTWTGTGSPVAGPDAYFTNDYNPACSGSAAFEDDILCAGPWNRISYPSSKKANAAPISPSTAAGVTIGNIAVATASGVTLSGISPLPAATNAVRWVHGKRTLGDIEHGRIAFRITDVSAFLASFSDDTFCLESTGGDTSDVAGKDNMWRYYEPEHKCFDALGGPGANGVLLKQIMEINNVPSSGAFMSASDIISWEVTFTNTSGGTLTSVMLEDTPDLNVALIEPGNALCAYTSYDGDIPGPTYSAGTASGGTATWATIGSMAAGDSVTVFLCGIVSAGVLDGDIVMNTAKVTYTVPVATVEMQTSSTTTVVADCIEDSDCPDDGDFCTAEICNAGNCETESPCAVGLFCCENSDSCVVGSECCEASDCVDPGTCLDATCDGGVCSSTATTCAAGEQCCAADGICHECCNAGDCSDPGVCVDAACDASGFCSSTPTSCPAGELCCNSDDTCHECCDAGDCSDPGVCLDAVCDASGMCSSTPSSCPAGQSCCDADDTCHICCDAADCPDPGPCFDAVCDAPGTCGSTPTTCAAGLSCCTADDTCHECCDANDCVDPGPCLESVCDASGTCGSVATTCAAGLSCCISDDTCHECCDASDCPNPGPCLEAVCDASGTCGSVATTCTAGLTCCPSDDTCHECCNTGDCSDPGVCLDAVCDAFGNCGSTPTSCPGGQSCCDTDDMCHECCIDSDCPADPDPCNNSVCGPANTCLPDPIVPCCGNGSLEASETCDPPGSPSGINNNLCRADCTVCGDGIVQAGEVCDDGNTNNIDACANDCTLGVGCSDNSNCAVGQICCPADNMCHECCLTSDCADPGLCLEPVCSASGICDSVPTTCPAGQSCCTADDACHDCCDSGDCPDPGVCLEPVCDASGTCGSVATTCSAGLTCCPADDTCHECCDASDCPDPGACLDAVCDASGTCGSVASTCSAGLTCCPADDTCHECCVTGDCADPGVCLDAVCDASGNCSSTPTSCPGGQSCCDSDDTCHECCDASDCPDPGVCLDATCDASGVCGSVATSCAAGESCCPADDTCHECCNTGDCADPGACLDAVCSVAGNCVSTPSSCPGGQQCCIANDTCQECCFDSNCPTDEKCCGNTNTCKLVCDEIPAVSDWGVVVIALLLLIAGKVTFSRRRLAT